MLSEPTPSPQAFESESDGMRIRDQRPESESIEPSHESKSKECESDMILYCIESYFTTPTKNDKLSEIDYQHLNSNNRSPLWSI